MLPEIQVKDKCYTRQAHLSVLVAAQEPDALMICCMQNSQKGCPFSDASQALGIFWSQSSSVISANTTCCPANTSSRFLRLSKSKSAYTPAEQQSCMSKSALRA